VSLILDPNKEDKLIKTPNEVPKIIIEPIMKLEIPNSNNRIYPASAFSKMIFNIDNTITESKPKLEKETELIPEAWKINITQTTLVPLSRKLAANWTIDYVDTVDFKYDNKTLSGYIYAHYIPVYQPTAPVYQTSTNGNNIIWRPPIRVDIQITFRHRDKTFAIYKENKELAEKLVNLNKKEWVTYLQYEDDGIVQLSKFLLGLEYKESKTFWDEIVIQNGSTINNIGIK
jgi:hypothetical protein